MFKLGIFCYSTPGHLNPTLSLARRLEECGYAVTFLQPPHAGERVRRAGFRFCAVGGDDSSETMQRMDEKLRGLTGLSAMRLLARRTVYEAAVFFRHAPGAVKRLDLDGLLVDHALSYGDTIAAHVGLPFVTLYCDLPLNYAIDIPLICFGYGRPTGLLKRVRDRAALTVLDRLWRPLASLLVKQRRLWGLDDIKGELAQVSQCPEFFDFPNPTLPPNFHYTGPFFDRGMFAPVSFPWERLDGRPLAYASLGTMVNRHDQIFQQVAAACGGLGLQVVISTGGARLRSNPTLDGGAIVVPFAPQYDLLERASVVITHAGLNTVLDCLTHGVPCVAVPLAMEQPGIAARLERLGVAQVVSPRRLSAKGLREAVSEVMTHAQYRLAAAGVKQRLGELDGLKLAAEIIDRCFSSQRAVETDVGGTAA